MNDRQLRYALAVWRERSFSRAAEKLGIAQPSLSEQIRLLEDEIGFDLFIRSSRGVEASTNGRTFLHDAAEVLTGMAALGELARDLRGAPGFTLRLGVGSGIAQAMVPAVVRALAAAPVRPRLDLITATTRRVQRLVDQQRLDAGLLIGGDPRSMPPDLVRRPFATTEVVAVTPPGHPMAAEAAPVGLAACARHPLILAETRIGYGQGVLSLFAAHGLSPDVVAVCDDIETVKLMVLSGAGVALAPRLAAAAEIAAGRLAAVALRPAQTLSLLLVRRPEPLPTRVEQCVALLAEALAVTEGADAGA